MTSRKSPMPTYQYRCTECGRDLEVVQKFSDPTLTECPTCQGQLRKIFNAVGVVFKGSGFYRTDSRKGTDSDGGTSEKSDKTGEKKTDAGGSEKKAETKVEKKSDSASTSTKAASSSTGSSSTGSSSTAA